MKLTETELRILNEKRELVKRDGNTLNKMSLYDYSRDLGAKYHISWITHHIDTKTGEILPDKIQNDEVVN